MRSAPTNSPPVHAEDLPWLLWDGDCALCCRAVTWARDRGAHRRFRIRAYQDAPSPPMDEALRRRAAGAVQIVFPDGRRVEAGLATLKVLEETGWGWFARALARRPWIRMVEALYGTVARNRRRLSRIWSRDPRRCRDEDAG